MCLAIALLAEHAGSFSFKVYIINSLSSEHSLYNSSGLTSHPLEYFAKALLGPHIDHIIPRHLTWFYSAYHRMQSWDIFVCYYLPLSQFDYSLKKKGSLRGVLYTLHTPQSNSWLTFVLNTRCGYIN